MLNEGLISEDMVQQLKGRKIGSDIPILWRVISGNKGPLGSWGASCRVECVTRIDPPITLSELKGEPRLRKWRDLRWNFQAQGRDALEIPECAWVVLKEMITMRVGPFLEELINNA
jgi:hypothetical protein